MDLASKYPDVSGEKAALLEFASQLVNTNLKYLYRTDVRNDKQMKVGFLLGAPGVHVSTKHYRFNLIIVTIPIPDYSGHPNTGLVQYPNGPKQIDH